MLIFCNSSSFFLSFFYLFILSHLHRSGDRKAGAVCGCGLGSQSCFRCGCCYKCLKYTAVSLSLSRLYDFLYHANHQINKQAIHTITITITSVISPSINQPINTPRAVCVCAGGGLRGRVRSTRRAGTWRRRRTHSPTRGTWGERGHSIFKGKKKTVLRTVFNKIFTFLFLNLFARYGVDWNENDYVKKSLILN